MNLSALEVVREGYERYARRDFTGVFTLLSPEIEILQTIDLPWGGRYQGHDGAKAFFVALDRDTMATPRPERYLSAGEDVVVMGRLNGTARASGKNIDLDIVHVWTVQNSLITRFAAYIDTPAMLAALAIDTSSAQGSTRIDELPVLPAVLESKISKNRSSHQYIDNSPITSQPRSSAKEEMEGDRWGGK